jgi:hypothetical protein
MSLLTIFHKNRLQKFLLLVELLLALPVYADTKAFLITLPVFTLGLEGALRTEFNLFQRGTLALESTEWVGKGKREELSRREVRENPGSFLLTEGRELGIMFGRYTDPFNMSGFNWGLGAGYRMMKIDWSKAGSDESNTSPPPHYNVRAEGPTVAARAGYRFVGTDIGFTLGSFLGVKYFLSQISNFSHEDTIKFSPISAGERKSLRGKLGTSFKIGVEIGWAF